MTTDGTTIGNLLKLPNKVKSSIDGSTCFTKKKIHFTFINTEKSRSIIFIEKSFYSKKTTK